MAPINEINDEKVALYCFGNTANGELGFGGIDEQSILLPRKQKSIDTNNTRMCIKQIACGRNHTLLLLTAHTVVKGSDTKDCGLISMISRVYSCGSNERQQLGREGTWKKFQMIPQLNNHLVIQINCGYNHSLVLTEAGQVFAFGCNLFGQLAVNVEDSLLKPTLIKKLAHEYVVQVSCGGNHSLALTKKGVLYAWGSNAFGQLGIGTSGNCEYIPVAVTKLSNVPLRYISAGGSHSIAVSSANNIYVWGKNEFGQLGLGDTTNKHSPTFQPALSNHEVCYVCCGDDHSAALTKDGGLFTWGAGMYGQLGHGKFCNELLPRRVFEMMGLQVTQVSCGRCHTLVVIGSKGRVYSFGLNGCGQLGIGTQLSEAYPAKISGPWIELDAKEVTVRSTAGPVVELSCERKEESDNGEWKENLDETMSIEDVDDIEVFSPERDSDLSPSASPMKVDDTCSPIVEEPEEVMHDSKACSRESVEISEYISDPDSDCETEKPISNRLVSSLGGTVPGSRPRLNHVKLLTATASKGDQSFILTTRLDINLSAVDYRSIGSLNCIYVFDNSVFETMLLIDADERIPDEIIEYIENTFGLVTSWNGSYLTNKSFPSLLRVDWEAAYYGFNCLRKCPNQRLTEIAMNVMEQQLFPSLPTTCGENGISDEILRVFVLLPLFHVFHSELKSSRTITDLFLPYSMSLKKLNRFAIQSLDKCWSSIHKEYFQNLIKAFKNAVIFTIKEIAQSMKEEAETRIINPSARQQSHLNLKGCLDFLKLLNSTNQRTQNVSYKEFYIPELHESADIKLDYIEWMGIRTDQTACGRSKPFYFCDYPFVFDVSAKTLILGVDSAMRQHSAAGRSIIGNIFVYPSPQGPVLVSPSPYFNISVNRENLVNSAAAQLLADRSADEYKKPLKINFENEEAIDAGAGVKKEFFILLMKELLDNKWGKFTPYEDSNTIWFNAAETHDYEMQMYELVGLVCGLTIYNQVIVYLPFPLPLYKKLLNEELKLDDLSYLDPYLTKNLKDILNTSYTENEFNAVYSDLNFSVSLNCYGQSREFELCENGKDKCLTYSNREEYVNLYWNFVLNKSVEKQFRAFNSGFRKVVESNVLTLFHAEELMQLVVGQCTFDWDVLEKEGTHYKEPFNSNHETIRMFWKVFHSFSEEEKRNFLLFLTGSDRIPILGMKSLGLLIQSMKVSDDHLPVAHTCFNVLDLPEIYSSEEKLKKKLLQAIQHTHGFSLA